MPNENEYSWIKSSEVISATLIGLFFLACLFASSLSLAFGLLLGGLSSLVNIRLIGFAGNRILAGKTKLPWSFWAINLGKLYFFAIVLFIGLVILKIDGLGFMVGFALPLGILTINGIRYYRKLEIQNPIAG